MEENENIIQEPIKEQKKGSYITGTIGAIIGGAIASIPWILVYAFGNMILAALTLLIAGGAFVGYKLLKGRIGKGLPAIITIVSIIVVTVVTLVVCPIILMAKEGVEVSVFNFKMLYSSSDMQAAIIQDLIMSLLFTGLGIASIVRSISIQIKKGVSADKLQFNTNAVMEEQRKDIQEKVAKIKEICTALNCMSKEKTVAKQEIMNELEMTHNIERKKAKQYVAIAKAAKLLKKYKGKYYYDETDEQAKINKICSIDNSNGSTKTLLGIIMLAIIVALVATTIIMGTGEKYTIPETDIELNISNSQMLCGTKEELAELFGEQYAEYYTFAILDNIDLESANSEYEIYGTLINKSDVGEEYDLNSLVQSDRDYIAAYWGEEGTSQVSDIKLGEKDFKTYSYKYLNQSGSEFSGVIYLCETGDKYLWIDLYADGSFEVTKANDIMTKLFK